MRIYSTVSARTECAIAFVNVPLFVLFGQMHLNVLLLLSFQAKRYIYNNNNNIGLCHLAPALKAISLLLYVLILLLLSGGRFVFTKHISRDGREGSI